MKTIKLLITTVWDMLFTSIKNYIWVKVNNKPRLIKIYNNTSFIFSPIGDIARIMFSSSHLIKKEKSFEYSTFTYMKNSINEGDTVLDIGANIGAHTMFLSKLVGNLGKVYSFEPNSSLLEIFNKNIALNKINNVSIVNSALGETAGTLNLVVPRKIAKGDGSGDAWGYISSNLDDGNLLLEKVNMITLDSFYLSNNIERINFIKIDIEGGELPCLKGAFQLLAKFKPSIIFECREEYQNRFNYTSYDLLSYLVEIGYSVKQYDQEQWIAEYKE